MERVENIEQQIEELSSDELTAFRRWFAQFDAAHWDRQMEEDIRNGRLDHLADQAISDHKAGRSKLL